MAKQIDQATLCNIIQDGDAVKLVNEADTLASAIATEGVSKSQIRNIFGEVRTIDTSWRPPSEPPTTEENSEARKNMRRLLLLKPRMAYQAKRDSKVPATKVLMDTLKDAVDPAVADTQPQVLYQRFKYFSEFLEAIVAYHTVYEKKNPNQ